MQTLLILVVFLVIAWLTYVLYLRTDTCRRIAVIIGSDSDLAQCEKGLEVLYELENHGKIKVLGVYTNSIHRNMFTVYRNLFFLWLRGVRVIIAGAGWASHLPGMCYSFYAYVLRTSSVVIIPVAFDGGSEERNQAAILSISQVPGHKMELCDGQVYFAAKGMEAACLAAGEVIFETKKLPEKRPAKSRSLLSALSAVDKKNDKGVATT